jgi:hypothetical protein
MFVSARMVASMPVMYWPLRIQINNAKYELSEDRLIKFVGFADNTAPIGSSSVCIFFTQLLGSFHDRRKLEH